MVSNATHSMFPGATRDEQARQDFVRVFKLTVQKDIGPGNRAIYNTWIETDYKKDRKNKITRTDIRLALAKHPYNQMWSSLLRTSQEMLCDSVGPSIERQLPQLVEQARKRRAAGVGSLNLDPKLEIPKYHTAVNIHCKPGGYHTELLKSDDVFAGAEYDRTVNMYLMGALGPNNDDIGASLAAAIRETYPQLAPRRILDIGCTIGHSTLAWCDAYPNAQIHAIDVAGPCLRYGYARADALNKSVHFHQMNAERTAFADGYFDIVVSHIMMHETSSAALPQIFKECHRLLVDGGVMAHADSRNSDSQAFDQYQQEWDAHYNNEPFFGTLHDTDLRELATTAGFLPGSVWEKRIPSQYRPGSSEHHINQAMKGSYFTIGACK